MLLGRIPIGVPVNLTISCTDKLFLADFFALSLGVDAGRDFRDAFGGEAFFVVGGVDLRRRAGGAVAGTGRFLFTIEDSAAIGVEGIGSDELPVNLANPVKALRGGALALAREGDWTIISTRGDFFRRGLGDGSSVVDTSTSLLIFRGGVGAGLGRTRFARAVENEVG